MFSHLSQFTLNAILVALVLCFHGAGAWGLIEHIGERRPIERKKVRIRAAAGILFLDFPLIYLQLVYKTWHPLVADQILYLIWAPWGLAMLNVSFLCLIILLYRFGVRPLRHWGDRRRRKENGRSRVNREMQPIFLSSEAMSKPATHTIHPVPLVDAVNSLEPAAEPKSPVDPLGEFPLFHRRSFLRTSAFALGGLVLNSSVLAAANGREENRIERVVVRIPNLPEGLKGTTIGMISDIHSSVFMTRENMEHYAKVLQDLKADLIVLPGDFVNSKVREVYPFAEAFSRLEAPLGVFGVTGNHDYYTREIDTVVAEAEQGGIRMLRNENIRLEKNGVSFRLMGMDDDAIYDIRDYVRDGRTEKGRIENLVRGIGTQEPTILLCHKPYPFEDYAQLGVNLTLSGHTHGGQIVLGKLDRMNLSLASLTSTYIAGLYKARSNPASQMYVSRGIGTVGLPVRINCPPEVTHVTLV